ncbi:hypothetical protein FACS189464_1010 [Bacteroidia bacterium]|nr:hypothetical protein FACS189464_1010 [Bacteroidia bacterium]
MNNIKEIAKIAVFMLLAVAGFSACKESDRITIGSGDNVPPGAPKVVDTMLLNGGVRIYYEMPSDEDVLSINAEYTTATGDVRLFSASYFTDSLDILGMTGEQTVQLYAKDRAGNKSPVVPINVTPLESTISQVFSSIDVKAGFDALVVLWENRQQQPVNVFVTIKYALQGVNNEATKVFTSNYPNEQQVINNLKDIKTVDATVHVEDKYGNVSKSLNKQIELYQDVVIPKDSWTLPNPNDTIGGIPMMFGDNLEGKTRNVIDGKIDFGDMVNYLQTAGYGRTGIAAHGNVPWNLIIDLGDYYELSRIVTHQAHQATSGNPNITRGNYYQGNNVGLYNMYVWVLDGDPRQKPWNTAGWELVSQHKIPVPVGLSNIELVKIGQAGDEALMYPDNPHYTKPVRWFRYEALNSFLSNYTNTAANVLSEVTLYSKKK